MRLFILFIIISVMGPAALAPRQAAGGQPDSPESVFRFYRFPGHPQLTHLCRERVYSATGHEITWDAFASPVSAAAPAKSYIIMAKGNSLPANLAQSVSTAGGTLTRIIPEVGLAVASSTKANFAAKAAKISGIRSVNANVTLQWIVPGRRESLDAALGNPPFSGDDDFFFDLQWGHDAVDAPEAWDAGYRGAGVRVAVLDEGIDSDHPDLAPNLNVGLSTSFVPGETFEYIENFPGDPFSHGTHVAGTIAAADNAFGTIGVAPEAEIVMVKVLSSFTGSGTFEGVVAGIIYAANIDADIINMSLGATIKKSGDCDPDCYTAKEAAELLVALGRATTRWQAGPCRGLCGGALPGAQRWANLAHV